MQNQDGRCCEGKAAGGGQNCPEPFPGMAVPALAVSLAINAEPIPPQGKSFKVTKNVKPQSGSNASRFA